MPDSDDAQLRLAQGKPSVTAQGAAVLRAAHQLLDVPLVFEDPLAVRVLGSDGEQALRSRLPSQQTPTARAMRALVVGRSRFAEDRLAEGMELGVRQHLLLGAGLDTYACRHSHGPARVFEVDHPATQAWKRSRLTEVGLAPPACLTFVPVDFEKDNLQASLAGAGFDSSLPAVVAWLGVSVYLTEEAVFETLRWAASLAKGSELVFDFGARTLEGADAELRDGLRATRVRVRARQEPWRTFFDPEELARRMRSLGFSDIETVSPDQLDRLYFLPVGSDLRMHTHLMRGRV